MDEKKKNILDISRSHLYNPTASLTNVFLSKRLFFKKEYVHAND